MTRGHNSVTKLSLKLAQNGLKLSKPKKQKAVTCLCVGSLAKTSLVLGWAVGVSANNRKRTGIANRTFGG